MNNTEEKFYQDVKTAFSGYAPEVPSHIYNGIREKMKEKKRPFFLTWSFNLITGAIVIAGLSWAVLSVDSGSEAKTLQSPNTEELRSPVLGKAHKSIIKKESSLEVGISEMQTPNSLESNSNRTTAEGYSSESSSTGAISVSNNDNRSEVRVAGSEFEKVDLAGEAPAQSGQDGTENSISETAISDQSNDLGESVSEDDSSNLEEKTNPSGKMTIPVTEKKLVELDKKDQKK